MIPISRVYLIVIVSQTCKQLQLVVDEHQVWLRQAIRIQVPIPPGTAPSKAELKDWVISRTRADVCWIKRRPGTLELHYSRRGIRRSSLRDWGRQSE